MPILVEDVAPRFCLEDIAQVHDLFPSMFTGHEGRGDCEMWSMETCCWQRIGADTSLEIPSYLHGVILRHYSKNIPAPSAMAFLDALGTLLSSMDIFDWVHMH